MFGRMLVLGVLALTAVQGTSCAWGQSERAGQKIAVLIGVKRYDNVNFSNLHYTENDVVELAKLLKPQHFEVTLLSDSQEKSHQPTRENILKHLDAALSRRHREDIVLFAFAGHGLQFEDDRASYFLPRDAEPGKSATMISLKTVYDKLEDCGAGVKLMFVDACRTQVDKRRRSAFDDKTPTPPRGVCALFSCSAGQSAMEMNDLRHGLFFYHILEGLRGNAKDAESDEVTILGLAQYAMRRVRNAGLNQSPVLKGEVTDGVLVRVGAATRKAGDTITNTIGMKLAYIPAGKFTMGSSKAERDVYPEGNKGLFESIETQHEVTLTKGYFMGVHEVTQAQFEKVMGKNPSRFSKIGDGHKDVAGLDTSEFPVEMVDWENAAEFCNKLSRLDGKTYRLPTEAEWEYAARSGTTKAFHFGDAINTDQVNFFGTLPGPGPVVPMGVFRKRPTPVGSFPPNAWGLYDMHGNVWEWCADWMTQDEYKRGACRDPKGPKSGFFRVMRGGSWFAPNAGCRSAYRGFDVSSPRSDVGFRVVCEATP